LRFRNRFCIIIQYSAHEDRGKVDFWQGLRMEPRRGIHYRDYEIQMEKGSKIFVYTDGVTEATDAEGNMFGKERLTGALREAENEDPKSILEHVRKSIDGFVGDAPQFDDITMLCLQYNGPERAVEEGRKD